MNEQEAIQLLKQSDIAGLEFLVTLYQVRAVRVDVKVDPSTIGDLGVSTPLNQCMGGGGGYPTERLSTLQIFVPLCRPGLPPDMMEMQVTGAVLWGQWQVK